MMIRSWLALAFILALSLLAAEEAFRLNARGRITAPSKTALNIALK
jgi:hypothetical protein